MLRKIKIHWAKWIDWVWLNNDEIKDVLDEYNFHELDVEACLEENQTARIDSYDDYLFIILHFPKYDEKTRSYVLNEFNIFIWKDFIITLEDFGWTHFDKIFEKYKTAKAEKDKEIKLSSGFILYEIIQVMLEKMFTVSRFLKTDIKQIENRVFDNASANLVKEIMIKKRNIMILKHMFSPQINVLKSVEFNIKRFFEWKIEAYFEDLEDKLDHIVNNINILEEYIDSIEDAFKTIIDMKTNNIIKLLTLFSAFILPLTLITSFYWMNIDLPFSSDSLLVYIMLVFCTIMMWFIYYYFKKKWKF